MNMVPTDHRIAQEFRRKVWPHGVKFPHQSTREMERRARQLAKQKAKQA